MHILPHTVITLVILWNNVLPSTAGASTMTTSGVPQKTANACFTQSSKVLHLECRPGEMLKINSVSYGHSPIGSCTYVEGDCIFAETMSYNCIGKQSCQINLPSGNSGRFIPKCQNYSTYMYVTYECIPEEATYDICGQHRITSQHGFLKTPRFPINYPDRQNCETVIQTQENQQINLYILDLNLETGANNTCRDELYMYDNYRSRTICGQRPKQHIFKTLGNFLNLKFTSDASGVLKGFWLYFEATPYVQTTVGTPETQTLSLPRTTPKPPHMPPTQSPPTIHQQTTDQNFHRLDVTGSRTFHIEIIVGVVMGVILIILTAVLIYLILRRRKERLPQEQYHPSLGYLNYANDNETVTQGSNPIPIYNNMLSDPAYQNAINKAKHLELPT